MPNLPSDNLKPVKYSQMVFKVRIYWNTSHISQPLCNVFHHTISVSITVSNVLAFEPQLLYQSLTT